MYCTKCGKENDNNAKFCVGCGNPLQQSAPGSLGVSVGNSTGGYGAPTGTSAGGYGTPTGTSAGGYGASTGTSAGGYGAPIGTSADGYGTSASGNKTRTLKKKQKKKIKVVPLLIATVLAVAVIAFPLTFLSGKFFGNTEEKIVKTFVEAAMEGKVDELFSLLPDEIMDALDKELQEEVGISFDTFNSMMKEQMDKSMDTVRDLLGDNWSYSYEIKNTEKIPTYDLDDIQETYEDEIGVDFKIEEGKEMTVEITMKGNDIENSKEMDISVIKVNGKWYLDVASLEDLM